LIGILIFLGCCLPNAFEMYDETLGSIFSWREVRLRRLNHTAGRSMLAPVTAPLSVAMDQVVIPLAEFVANLALHLADAVLSTGYYTFKTAVFYFKKSIAWLFRFLEQVAVPIFVGFAMSLVTIQAAAEWLEYLHTGSISSLWFLFYYFCALSVSPYLLLSNRRWPSDAPAEPAPGEFTAVEVPTVEAAPAALLVAPEGVAETTPPPVAPPAAHPAEGNPAAASPEEYFRREMQINLWDDWLEFRAAFSGIGRYMKQFHQKTAMVNVSIVLALWIMSAILVNASVSPYAFGYLSIASLLVWGAVALLIIREWRRPQAQPAATEATETARP
jgi:hypothetical protein